MESVNIPLKKLDQKNFDEEQWMRMLFLISDTHSWLNDMSLEFFHQIPLVNSNKLHRKSFYITATAFAHILEKHYYKIQRYPGTGKFTIPVIEILSYLRDGFHQPVTSISGSLNFQRIINAEKIIGHDRIGKSTNIITIITDACGKIITAFPGQLVDHNKS